MDITDITAERKKKNEKLWTTPHLNLTGHGHVIYGVTSCAPRKLIANISFIRTVSYFTNAFAKLFFFCLSWRDLRRTRTIHLDALRLQTATNDHLILHHHSHFICWNFLHSMDFCFSTHTIRYTVYDITCTKRYAIK